MKRLIEFSFKKETTNIVSALKNYGFYPINAERNGYYHKDYYSSFLLCFDREDNSLGKDVFPVRLYSVNSFKFKGEYYEGVLLQKSEIEMYAKSNSKLGWKVLVDIPNYNFWGTWENPQ